MTFVATTEGRIADLESRCATYRTRRRRDGRVHGRRRKRQTLEKLREQALGRWRIDVLKDEQKQLDEAGGVAFARAMIAQARG